MAMLGIDDYNLVALEVLGGRIWAAGEVGNIARLDGASLAASTTTVRSGRPTRRV